MDDQTRQREVSADHGLDMANTDHSRPSPPTMQPCLCLLSWLSRPANNVILSAEQGVGGVLEEGNHLLVISRSAAPPTPCPADKSKMPGPNFCPSPDLRNSLLNLSGFDSSSLLLMLLHGRSPKTPSTTDRPMKGN